MTDKTDKDAKKHKIDTSNCRPSIMYGNVVIKTEMPEVIYAGMARDLDGNEIGGYWQEEPQGEPKYILADTSISKAEHNLYMKNLREAKDAEHLAAMNEMLLALKDYYYSNCGLKKICGHEFECTCPSDRVKAILSTTTEGKE